MKRVSTVLALLVSTMMPTAKETLKTNARIDLDWRPDGTATAQIEQWPLEKVLQSLSDQGKWEIFVEPDLQMRITTRFKDLNHPEALRRLLNNVNFALIPSPANSRNYWSTKPHQSELWLGSFHQSARPSANQKRRKRQRSSQTNW